MKLAPFQSLLEQHGRDVHRFLIANVGPIDADDCWQETWLAALRAYPSLSDGSHLRAWVFTIAHRKAIDHVRARSRRAIPVADATALASSGARAATVAAPAPVDEQLWSSVAQLPDKQRVALTLRFIADSRYAEIAEVMGTSEPAARRNVHEALTRLRKETDR